jgi:hypothetical protein
MADLPERRSSDDFSCKWTEKSCHRLGDTAICRPNLSWGEGAFLSLAFFWPWTWGKQRGVGSFFGTGHRMR